MFIFPFVRHMYDASIAGISVWFCIYYYRIYCRLECCCRSYWLLHLYFNRQFFYYCIDNHCHTWHGNV